MFSKANVCALLPFWNFYKCKHRYLHLFFKCCWCIFVYLFTILFTLVFVITFDYLHCFVFVYIVYKFNVKWCESKPPVSRFFIFATICFVFREIKKMEIVPQKVQEKIFFCWFCPYLRKPSESYFSTSTKSIKILQLGKS